MSDRYRRELDPSALRMRRVRCLVIVALGSLSLVAAACSSNPVSTGVASLGSTTSTTVAPSTGGGSSSPSPQADAATLLKFAQCMRNHGLTTFPDPTSQGNIDIQNIGKDNPNSPQFQTAQHACQSLMPGALITPAEKAAANTKALAFAQCMRAHGIVNFPDPNGEGVIKITSSSNLSLSTPQYDKAQSTCQNLSNGFDMETQGGAGGPAGNSGG
ncbi:MAG: hypothetical protein ABSG36_09960 [Acidimicrobiales bacterium]|jgi:hypothetical protein